jgi:ribonuclease P/MRP protein subunit POP1
MAKTKKERELIKQQQKNAEKESVGGTPGSQDTEMGQQVENNNGGREIKLNTGGKPASYIPWHTCPSCKRSLLITRFAQHLEKCLGISGRQSSRNAMAKLTGQNGGSGSTPLGGSRMGTPTPSENSSNIFRSSKSKLADVSDAENDTTEKKLKKKKGGYIKKADRARLGMDKEGSGAGGGGILKVKLKSNGSLERKASFNESPEKNEKRERDENDDGAPKAKKLKLSLGRSDSVGGGGGEGQAKREMS